MDARQARGRVLAQAQGDRIRHIEGEIWYVPSSQGSGYLVDMSGAGRCGCPDAAERCKHLVAVEIIRGAQPKAEAVLVVAAPAPAPPKAAPPPRGDLTVEEQRAVRRALKFIRTRAGGWAAVAKGTRLSVKTLKNVAYERMVSASVAVRLARFAGASVDDVIGGRWPPEGSCPYCGHCPSET